MDVTGSSGARPIYVQRGCRKSHAYNYLLLIGGREIYIRFCIIFIKENTICLQWSFGVVMWEIFTLAATPYPEIPNSDMRNHMRTGVRLEKPETTPVAL